MKNIFHLFLRIGNYILKYYNVKLFFERLLKKFTFQLKKQPVTIFWFLLRCLSFHFHKEDLYSQEN